MKIKLIAALLASASILPMTVLAEEGPYAGASLGRTQQKLYTSGLTATMHETGFRLHGGYQVDENWGVEAGFSGLGKTTMPVSAKDHITGTSRAFYAAGTYKLPIQKFFLMAKAGIAKNHVEVETNLVKGVGKEDKSDAYLSFGGGYNFNSHLSVVLDYENYGSQANYQAVGTQPGLVSKLRMISTGVRYAF